MLTAAGMELTGIRRHDWGSPSAREGEDDGNQLRQTLPQEGAKIAHFCSMKITEDVRKYAAEQGITESEAVESGLKEKAREFVDKGAELYASLPSSRSG